MSRIYHLSVAARPTCDSDYGSASQVAAENAFVLACENAFPDIFCEGSEFGGYVLKATTDEAIDEALAQILARSFSHNLREELEPDDIAAVIAANVGRKSGCASHDYCDSNMCMLYAFNFWDIPAPCEVQDGMRAHSHACALWNRAWDIARDSEFKA